MSMKPNVEKRQLPADLNGRDEVPEVFRRILERTRDLGVGDLAEQHDHYLYGTPKR
jgi:hypothetical protein